MLWLRLWMRLWTESHCPRCFLLFHLRRLDVLAQSIFLTLWLPADVYLFIYFPMRRLNSISWIQELDSGCWSERPGWGGAPAIVPFQGCQSDWWLLGPLITSFLFVPPPHTRASPFSEYLWFKVLELCCRQSAYCLLAAFSLISLLCWSACDQNLGIFWTNFPLCT